MNNKMRELVDKLNYATVLYDKGQAEMSDREWDDLYFELLAMEKEAGYTLPNSPTQKVYFETVSELNKITHSHPMLSLAKTKDIAEVKSFIGNKDYIAMLKLDGLTCSLTYENGLLVQAETRGNGVVGEDVLHNARVINSIPKRIPYKDRLVVDGEVICTQHDFEAFRNEYKNPRNFASGSIRLLDSSECAKRKLTFVAWDVIEGYEDKKTLSEKLVALKMENLFTVAPMRINVGVEKSIEELKEVAHTRGYPIDGLVFKYNDCAYYQSLGATEHHFRGGLAYKFYDETYPTKLNGVEWTMGRTGVLTPVALFEPIDADGSVIERASLHNVSVMKELLGDNMHVGQSLDIFKANMIIPQVKVADKNSVGEPIAMPTCCPVCGGEIKEKTEIDSTVLMCMNSSCEGKLINKLDHFCGKKGLDMKGLSKMTLEKLINWGWITNVVDLYKLKDYRDEWRAKPGFGAKSVDKVLDAIESSKNCELGAFICSLGIPLIGTSASKDLCKKFNSWSDFRNAVSSGYKFYNIDGFGSEMHSAIVKFNYDLADALVSEHLNIQEKVEEVATLDGSSSLEGITVVITGKLTQFKNRATLQAEIEKRGGKVVGSVSGNTGYLINNDNTSATAKNVSAQKLGVPVVTESEFMSKFF